MNDKYIAANSEQESLEIAYIITVSIKSGTRKECLLFLIVSSFIRESM